MGLSRTWPGRLVAAVTSLALVGAGLVTLAHHVETRHEICAEHGELMHVTGDGITVVELAADSISDDPLDLDHDEHCAIAWSTSELIEPAASGQRAIVAADPDRAAAPSADDLRSAALYRLAPKTSPPA